MNQADKNHPRLVIDWSVLMYMNWHKMRAPDYVAETDKELVEFSRNITAHALYLVHRFRPSELILAVDSTEKPSTWRAAVYDSYYSKNVEFWKDMEQPHTWVVSFDRKYYRCSQDQQTELWAFDKLGKDEKIEFTLAIETGSPKYIHWPQGNIPAWILEQYPEAPRNIWEHPDGQALRELVPTYKGNRKTQRWDYETTKAEMKQLGANLAHNLAPVLGGRAVECAPAEGDDIAALFCLAEPGTPTILVTIDQDLQQLAIPCSGLQIFNPVKHTWDTPTADQARYKLAAKILGGDPSDNIAGVILKDREPFSPISFNAEGLVENGKNAEKWLRTTLQGKKCGGDYGKLWDLLEAEQEAGTYTRNFELVFLGCIPEAVKAKALAAIAAPAEASKYSLADFGVGSRLELSQKQMADNDRTRDMEGGTLWPHL